MQQYCVITGDMVRSRQLPDRAAAQRRLQLVLTTINRRHAPLAAEFSPVGGDGFQGVLNDIAPVVAVAVDIALELLPLRARYGIGVGAITTDVGPVAAMDGPAFHRSREALEGCRRQRQSLIMSSGDELIDRTANTMFLSLDRLLTTLTDRQAELLREIRTGAMQAELADRLELNKSTVHRTLKRASARELDAIQGTIAWLLRRQFGSTDADGT